MPDKPPLLLSTKQEQQQQALDCLDNNQGLCLTLRHLQLEDPPCNMTASSPVLAAFGNPLLDIIVREGCEGLVEKYGLARNIAQEVDTIKTGLHAEVTQR